MGNKRTQDDEEGAERVAKEAFAQPEEKPKFHRRKRPKSHQEPTQKPFYCRLKPVNKKRPLSGALNCGPAGTSFATFFSLVLEFHDMIGSIQAGQAGQSSHRWGRRDEPCCWSQSIHGRSQENLSEDGLAVPNWI